MAIVGERDQFFSVSESDLALLHQRIIQSVLPTHTLFIRESLDPHLVKFQEDDTTFSLVDLNPAQMDAEEPKMQFLAEVDVRSCPEFVTEASGSPFAQDIDPRKCEFTSLDKARFNSILRVSSDLIQQVNRNLKTEVKSMERHNISEFYTEFYLNNKPVSPKKAMSLARGVLQILFVFDISYRS